jgi:hypothetical protein
MSGPASGVRVSLRLTPTQRPTPTQRCRRPTLGAR